MDYEKHNKRVDIYKKIKYIERELIEIKNYLDNLNLN